MSVKEAKFWLAHESSEHFSFQRESLGVGSARIILIVEDPNATFRTDGRGESAVIWRRQL